VKDIMQCDLSQFSLQWSLCNCWRCHQTMHRRHCFM